MRREPTYRRGEVLWRRTSDRVVILLPQSGEFITLRESGCDLWAALETPASVEEIALRLATAYGAPVERVTSDITPIIGELERLGALVLSRCQ